ncbi:MAG: hypothetical protein U1E59_01115 [Amaricoccus sp.]
MMRKLLSWRRAGNRCGTSAERVAGAAILVFSLLLLGPAHGQVTPAQATAAKPEVCKIGINVEDLYDLDMARDTFGAILWIWSLCPSADLAPLDTITFPTVATGPSLGPVEVVNVASGGQYTSRRIQGTFRHNWDMARYPFDRQHLVIPIDESRYEASRLVFEPDRRESFLTPDIRTRLDEWNVSDLALETSISEEPSTYGLPESEGARYARLEIAVDLERIHLFTFLKLTSGVFAGAFIGFLSFFYDPNDRSGFGGKLGLLIGVLFAVLLSLRNADASIGDTGHLTLVTQIHLVTLAFVVLLALVALRDRRRVERGLMVRHPDWHMLAAAGSLYVVIIGGLIASAAWS